MRNPSPQWENKPSFQKTDISTHAKHIIPSLLNYTEGHFPAGLKTRNSNLTLYLQFNISTVRQATFYVQQTQFHPEPFDNPQGPLPPLSWPPSDNTLPLLLTHLPSVFCPCPRETKLERREVSLPLIPMFINLHVGQKSSWRLLPYLVASYPTRPGDEFQ